MKLAPWRGPNVVIACGRNRPVLELDQRGNLKESDGSREPPAQAVDVPSLDRLAARVAIWIEWTATEACEFRLNDIHPDIRAQVARIAAPFVCADGCTSHPNEGLSDTDRLPVREPAEYEAVHRPVSTPGRPRSIV
jgi:hypothetical protein